MSQINADLQSSLTMMDILIETLIPSEKQAAAKETAKFYTLKAFAAGMAEESKLDHNHALSQYVTRIGGYRYDALGGVAVTLFIVEAPDTETVRERLVEVGVEAQHCQHEYDCCAHWYGNEPHILQTLNSHSEYLVEWRQYQNV